MRACDREAQLGAGWGWWGAAEKGPSWAVTTTMKRRGGRRGDSPATRAHSLGPPPGRSQDCTLTGRLLTKAGALTVTGPQGLERDAGSCSVKT